MSEKKAISIEEFKNRATRLIDIDGFEEGEKITVRVKSVSLLAMMTKGKLPNELKAVVASLFNTDATKGKTFKADSVEEIAVMQQLMDKVCAECLIEPAYSEVEEFLTDAQKTQIFMAAQGNVKAHIPTNEK